MIINKTRLLMLAIPFLSGITFAQPPSGPFSDYSISPEWQVVNGVNLSSDKKQLVAAGESENPRLLISQESPGIYQISSKMGFGDATYRLKYMVSSNTEAYLYVQSRYAIPLTSLGGAVAKPGDAGGLLAKNDGISDRNKYSGVAPKQLVNIDPGAWNTLELKFRAPRYDEASKKVDNAFFLEILLNGVKVQENLFLTEFSTGSKYPWEEPYGPLMVTVKQGSISFDELDVRHADFGEITVPKTQGGKTNLSELTDFVQTGKESFTAFGCSECHAIGKNDTAVKTGPNLFGLFQAVPRDRQVVEADSGAKFTIKADHSYLVSSVRAPATQLATQETGNSQGEAFFPVMPAYPEQLVSDKQLDAIGAYLMTLNDRADQGPVVKLVTAEGPQKYDPLEDSLQLLVKDRVRIQRGPMEGLSGRTIHIGQPNGIHYSFDPRLLAVAKVWQGGFLDVTGELTNRGGGGFKLGFDTRLIDLGATPYLIAPINSQGELIDFSFKESIYGDKETIKKSLYSEKDHFELIKSVDAKFKGYELNSQDKNAAPTFKYQIGKNNLAIAHQLLATGEVIIRITGEVKSAQNFLINTSTITSASVSAGKLVGNQWSLPKGKVDATLKGKMAVAANPWQPKAVSFDHLRQPLKTIEAKASLPDGYLIESYLPPKDNFGRPQLFEALGLDVAKDGTVVVATRTAGIWRLVKGEWQLFAEGTFDSLGVQIEDDKGLKIVVGQKPELTRISDTNGDGLADKFDTLFDGHSYHNNYHTYMHGPARGADGAYYVNFNLSHTNESVYKAGGGYMGTEGGFAGWTVRVTPEGEASLFAKGLRSPAGLAKGSDGRLWYTENQGEYVSTSKIFILKKDAFYGHPSGLVDLPGMNPDSPEIAWDKVKGSREQALILLPHNQVANSPGHPVWDTTGGKFGAFAEQMFVGDQTQSNLLRVVVDKVNSIEQGAVMPFFDNLESGVMRPVFLPDGSLLLGQTGRGWQAKGGHVASLQRVYWDGKTLSQAIKTVKATQKGFSVELIKAVPTDVDEQSLLAGMKVSSWVYRDAPDYGSDRLSARDEALVSVTLSVDRKNLTIELADLSQPVVHPEQTARVYWLQVNDGKLAKPMSAFYTLYKFQK